MAADYLTFTVNGTAYVYDDPENIAGPTAGYYWRDVKMQAQHVRFDEYEYPGYDKVFTRRHGKRKQPVDMQLILVGDTAAQVETTFQTQQALFLGQVIAITLPYGTAFSRCRVTKYQQTNRIMPWGTKFYMLLDCSFEALEASSS